MAETRAAAPPAWLLDSRAVPPETLRLTGHQGLELHALEWSREGTAMLFLHGFSNSCRVWDGAASAMAPFYRVLALDQRGHGDSGHDPERRYDPETMALDLEAVLAALEIERVVLVGHSMGGRVSMQFAARRPELLAGLVLVDIGPENDPRGELRIRQDAERQDWTFDSVEQYLRLLTRQYPETSPEVLERMARHWTRLLPDGRFELKLDPCFLARRESTPRTEAGEREWIRAAWDGLRKPACPALVVRGAASDILAPETADKMVDEFLSDGRLEIVPRAAHSVMLDNPEGFERALSRFALGED